MQNKELVYKAEDESLVVIIPEVIRVFLSYRQLNITSPESAGVIIGERRDSHIVIKTVSEPNANDIRSRFTVNRIGAHHQKKVDQAFIESEGTLQYLGEWHTHPEDIPTPSGLDFASWNENLNSDLPLILIIVGRKKFWVAKKSNQKIITLAEI